MYTQCTWCGIRCYFRAISFKRAKPPGDKRIILSKNTLKMPTGSMNLFVKQVPEIAKSSVEERVRNFEQMTTSHV